jgi:hypothetical protein
MTLPSTDSEVESSPIDLNGTLPCEASGSPGVFSLREEDEEMVSSFETAHVVEVSRSGGTKASLDKEDETAVLEANYDPAASNFPMIVWLRGDESWFGEFNMDADGVMKTLGIKRSRLTQISGRDLRVGRVRVDRYIRPIYRLIDVQQYLTWTRATASHQKSSDSIKMATDHLHEQSLLIQSTMETLTAGFTESLREDMSTFIANTVGQGLLPMQQKVDAFQSSITALTSDLTAFVAETMNSTIEQLKQTCAAIQESSRLQSAALEILALQLNQTSEKTAAIDERLALWDKTLTERLVAIGSEVRDLNEPAPFRKMTLRKKRQHTNPAKLPTLKLSARAAPSRRKPK